MKRIFTTSAGLVLLLAFITCMKPKQVIPEKPELSNTNYAKITSNEKTQSSVTLPIEIPLNTLLEKLNASISSKKISFKETIDCPETPLPREEHCRVQGHIDFGSIKLSGAGKTLSAKTSFYGKSTMWIKYRIRVGPINDGRETDKNVHYKGTLAITAAPTVDHNWGIKPNIRASINFSEAYIHFGKKVSFRKLAKKLIEPYLNKEIQKIEAQIYKDFNIRKQLQPFWTQLSNPIKLSKEYNIWSVIRPTKIHYNEIDIKNNVMRMGLGVDFENFTYVGDQPKPKSIPPIPNLSKSNSITNQFDLRFPLIVSYNELTALVNDNIANKELELEDVSVKLNNIQIYGDDSHVFVKTAFNATHNFAKASGVLYFKAKPVLEQGQLSLKDLDFEIKTKNLLVETAEWLLKPQLIAQIKEAAVYDVTTELEYLKADLNKQIDKIEIQKAASLKGKIETISVGEVKLSKNGVYIIVGTKGKLNAYIKKIVL